MEIDSVRTGAKLSNQRVLLLKQKSTKRYLPIYIDSRYADILMHVLKGQHCLELMNDEVIPKLQYVGIISTKILGLDTFLLIMVILIVGGLGRFLGVILGSFAVTFLSYYLRPLEHYRMVIFGVIVLMTVILLPGGIMEAIDRVSPSIRHKFKKTQKA